MNKKIVSLIRIAILLAIFTFAAILFFGEESGSDVFTVLLALVNKLLAAVLFCFGQRLYSRWSLLDPWLKADARRCKEVAEAPNPMYIDD